MLGRQGRRHAGNDFRVHPEENGIDPKTDLTIDQSIDFGLTAAAFTGNDADYTVEFEPHATSWSWRARAMW